MTVSPAPQQLVHAEIRSKRNRLVGMCAMDAAGRLKSWMFSQQASQEDREEWMNIVSAVRTGMEPHSSDIHLQLL